MAVEDAVNVPADILSTTLLEIGKIGLWLQAIGILAAIWFASIIITLILNRKKRKALYTIKDDLKRIETKIDKISENLNKK